MTATKTPAIETYREALEQLTIAVNALDQAHAMLRDLKLHDWIVSNKGPYRKTVKDTYNIVTGLLDDAKALRCPDCNAYPMTEACFEGTCIQEGENNG